VQSNKFFQPEPSTQDLSELTRSKEALKAITIWNEVMSEVPPFTRTSTTNESPTLT